MRKLDGVSTVGLLDEVDLEAIRRGGYGQVIEPSEHNEAMGGDGDTAGLLDRVGTVGLGKGGSSVDWVSTAELLSRMGTVRLLDGVGAQWRYWTRWALQGY